MAAEPRPMSLIDTGLIAGAGKSILQLYAHPQFAERPYLIANFDYGGRLPTEFNDAAREGGYRLALLSQRFGLDPSPIATVARLLREHDLNVLETHGYKGHLIGAWLAATHGVAWVATAHGWTDENLKIRVYNALERFLLARADVAVTVSPPLFDTVAARRRSRPTHLVLNAIDLPELTPRAPRSGPLTLGVVGRMSPEKGQDLMLDAFATVQARHPGTRLRLIGDGQERERLHARAEQLGLLEHVTFTGWVSDMAAQYAALDLLVIPSRSEGLPFALLEAMSRALPVVATDVGAVRDVLQSGDTGWVVPPGAPAALADAVNAALTDPGALAGIGARARASLHPRFSPDERARRMQAVYAEAIEAAAARSRLRT